MFLNEINRFLLVDRREFEKDDDRFVYLLLSYLLS